ncbi:MAG: GntR family transcriptional regulator [Propionibacteriales bacterium]|nr:GntR family transcriptional regulator [Propionibacteriales bacterium]
MPKSRSASELHRDRAVSVIRDLVTSGVVSPGDRLVERTLSSELALSRVPVREALQVMVAEGFAAERPTGGVVVRQHTLDEVAELLDISHALDAVAVRRLDQAGVAALLETTTAAGRALEAGDHAAAVRANADFHDVLLGAGSSVLREVSTPIRARLRWLMEQHHDPRQMHREHLALIDAVAGGKAERITTVLDQHLATSRAALAARRSES